MALERMGSREGFSFRQQTKLHVWLRSMNR